MDKNEYYNDVELEDEDRLEIDWAGYVVKIVDGWKKIAIVAILAAVLGVGVAITRNRTYTVSVVLAPESQGRAIAGNASSIAGMLGLGNISAGGEGDALNINLFPEISQSTKFLTSLFDVRVTPYMTPEQIEKGNSTEESITLFDYFTKSNDKSGVISRLFGDFWGSPQEDVKSDTLNLSQLTLQQHNVVSTLQSAIKVEVTGVVTISVTMGDPWIATTLADTVCSRLQNYVIAYRTKKAAEDLAYYEVLAAEAKEKMIKAQSEYALSVDFDRSVILQSVNSEKDRLQREAQLASDIYSQMAQQVELAKAKLQEVKPVYAVIEAATMPNRPSSTSRKNIVLGFMFVGACFALAWVLFGKDLLGMFAMEVKNRMEKDKIEKREKITV